MRFAEFFRNGVSACGSDSVCHIDGRFGTARAKEHARAYARKLNTSLNKGYTHFTLNCGGSFLNSRVESGPHNVS